MKQTPVKHKVLIVTVFFLNITTMTYRSIAYLLKPRLFRICIYTYQIIFSSSYNVFFNFPTNSFLLPDRVMLRFQLVVLLELEKVDLVYYFVFYLYITITNITRYNKRVTYHKDITLFIFYMLQDHVMIKYSKIY